MPDGAETEPWASLAEENNPGNVATASPILILHSAADDVVPAALSAALFDRMCSLGQVVERRVYEDGEGHAAAARAAGLDGFDWIEKRFTGQPAISTCPPPGAEGDPWHGSGSAWLCWCPRRCPPRWTACAGPWATARSTASRRTSRWSRR